MNGTNLLLILVLLPMAAALACYAVGRCSKKRRNDCVCLTAVVEMLLTLLCAAKVLKNGAVSLSIPSVVGLGLSFEMDGFRVVYCVIVALMWLCTLFFSREYFAHYHNRNRYYFFNLLTLGATMGVFLSADLGTTLVFFEVMSFTSYTWVIHEEDPASTRAANTYLAVAVIGGLAALMGLFLLHNTLGTLELSKLYDAAQSVSDKTPLYVAGGCILFGFGAKAGMFPVHIWLPKAHPVAPAPASALLSGILTKTGVFGILAISCNIFRHDPAWGTVILSLGVITMVLGAVLALLSVNLKRTLACSSMSQIGFILVGVGMMGLLGEENALAARGALLHMVNHSMFKLLLFMVAGTVYMNLHQLDLNDIQGYGRNKPLLKVLYLIGAVGIGGIPGLSGYISKTLLHESIVEYTHLLTHAGQPILAIKAVEWLFLFSGGLTLAYMTKLYIAVFVKKHPTRQDGFDAQRRYMTPVSAAALLVPAAIIPILGLLSHQTMDALADLSRGFFHAELPAHAVAYFSLENLKGAVISVAVAAAVYLLVVNKLLIRKGRYVNVLPQWLDLEDRIYRPVLLKLLPDGLGLLAKLFGENLITAYLAKKLFSAVAAIGAWFGENALLAPVSRLMLRASALVSHLVCDLTDALVVLLRKTLYRQSRERADDHYSRTLAYRFGHALDELFGRRRRGKESCAERFVRVEETVSRTTWRITGNLSFALLMLCGALCLAFIYLLFIRF